MGEEKQIIMYANLPEPQKLTAEKVTGEYHLVARSEGLVSMTVNLPSNVNSVVDFYFNRHIHKEVQAVDGVATLIVKAETEEDKDREFPSEVLREPGFTVSIIYENNNNQITTNYVFFPVYTNGIGEEPLEYDDDSYIDAKIAREAAEYALEEIDDLTDRVTTLESGLTTLSSVVETTISSLEEFEETTTSSFITIQSEINGLNTRVCNIENWITVTEPRIFYDIEDGNYITITSCIPDDQTNIIHCPGVITNNQTTMEFTLQLPKRIRPAGTGYHYEIWDLAILARGGQPGYYRDYYAHGFREYGFVRHNNDTWMVNEASVATALVPDHTGGRSREHSYEFYNTISDCPLHCNGTYPRHYYAEGERQSSRNMEISLTPNTGASNQCYFLTTTTSTTIEGTTTTYSYVSDIHWPTTGVSLNCPGLLVKDNGKKIGISVWNRVVGKNEVTSTQATIWKEQYSPESADGYGFETSSEFFGNQTLKITIKMCTGRYWAFPNNQDGADKYVRGINSTLAFQDTSTSPALCYKKWIPFPNGTGDSDIFKTGDETLDARWLTEIPRHLALNNVNVDVGVTVLRLKRVAD